MKKYYLIRQVFEFGFWNEAEQDYLGINYATKYEFDPSLAELDQLRIAANKKPCIVVEVYYPN